MKEGIYCFGGISKKELTEIPLHLDSGDTVITYIKGKEVQLYCCNGKIYASYRGKKNNTKFLG